MSQPPMGPESQGPGVPPPYGQPSDATPPPYGGAPSGAPAPGYGQPGPGYGQPGPGGQPPLTDSDRRLWAMLAHLGGIILGFIAPLIVWAIYKDRDEFVKDQSQEALNFQLTLLIAYILGSILAIVIVGFVLLVVAGIASLVFSIIGGLAANKGERYRYPFAIRLIK